MISLYAFDKRVDLTVFAGTMFILLNLAASSLLRLYRQ